jgi:hypothetical protein
MQESTTNNNHLFKTKLKNNAEKKRCTKLQLNWQKMSPTSKFERDLNDPSTLRIFLLFTHILGTYICITSFPEFWNRRKPSPFYGDLYDFGLTKKKNHNVVSVYVNYLAPFLNFQNIFSVGLSL